MPQVGVIHLIRAANGLAAFERFLESYLRTSKEPEHELILIFKGFERPDHGKEGANAYRKLLASQPYRELQVRDFGFDIRPYFVAARACEHPYLFFFNSWGRVVDARWIEKMLHHLRQPGVGLVGATASCQSWASYAMDTHDEVAQLASYRGPLGRARLQLRHRLYRKWYDPFPNYHVRSTLFGISRDVMLKIHHGPLLRKSDAYRFESGKNGLTKQIRAMGMRPILVGRDGMGYEMEDWHRSNIYLQGDQGNLLLSDNQTARYQDADAATRLHLSRASWGPLAAPDLTCGAGSPQNGDEVGVRLAENAV